MIPRIYALYKSVMLTPEALLSVKSRERCVAKLKELPVLVRGDAHKREAAVLIPLCVVNGEVCLLFTLRSSNLPTHKSQVSFPGGKMDTNETVQQAALRETEEEIGVPRNEVDVWASMSRVQGRDRAIVITPVVGELKNFDMAKLNANEGEVAEIFTVPMKTLCDQNNHGYFEYNNIYIPVYICGKHKVWGITGMITHMFLECFLPSESYQPDFLRKEYELHELMPSKL